MHHIYDKRHELTDTEKTICKHFFIDLSHYKNIQDS